MWCANEAERRDAHHENERKTTLQDIPYRVSIAMRGAGCVQVAAAIEGYLLGGQARRGGEETWAIDDCLGRTGVAIGGTDDIDTMFEERTDRCILISPLLAYEDMDDLLRLMGEVCSATGVEGELSCGIRVFADLGEANPRAEANLHDLVLGKQALLTKVLKTDIEAFRPQVEGRARRIASGKEGACEVFYCDAASSLDPNEARATLQFALAVAAQAVNQRRVNAKVVCPENERYAFRCWMLKMGLVGDEYKPMRGRFLKRLPGDSATKALRSDG